MTTWEDDKGLKRRASEAQLDDGDACWTFASWNVGGLSACLKKGFVDTVASLKADVLCLQETKLSANPATALLPKNDWPFQHYAHCTTKKGYAGSAVFSKTKPLSVKNGLPGLTDEEDQGRTITLEFQDFWFVAAYVPNAGMRLERLEFKLDYCTKMQAYLETLQKTSGKPIIYGGDLNVAHQDIDLARPKTNHKTPGFTPQERKAFTALLENENHPMVDTYRALHPKETDKYTYYSYRFSCKAKNIGWRLDYFTVSKSLMDRVEKAEIHSDAYGASDHVPVSLVLKTSSQD